MYERLTPETFDSLMQVLGPGSSTRPNCRGWELVAFGFLLGLAGSSFAMDVPFVSRWYAGPGQGAALGVYGTLSGSSATCCCEKADARHWYFCRRKWVQAAGPAVD